MASRFQSLRVSVCHSVRHRPSAHDDAILEVRPLESEVETAIRLIEASGPEHFDAALERWRNTQPGA